MADVQQLYDAAVRRVGERAEKGTPAGQLSRYIEALVGEMKSAAAQPELLARLMTAARALISTSVDCAEGAVDAGCGIVALTALRRYPVHAEVARGAFELLATVAPALSPGEATSLMRETVRCLTCDAACALATCDVAWLAATALNNVTANNDPKKQAARIMGAVVALTTAMKRFPAHELLQSTACGALHGLFNIHATQTGAGDALDATMAAIRAFPASVNLQQNASLAISGIVVRDTALQRHCVRAGGLPLLAGAIRRHMSVAAVCEAASLAISNLELSYAESAAPVAECEAAFQCVVEALLAHSAHAPTVQFGVRALGCLCMHSTVAPLAASSRALNAVVAGMGAHVMDVNVQTAGCLALFGFFNSHPPARKVAVEAGAIQALVRALRTSVSRRAVRAGAADFEGFFGEHDEGEGPKAYAVGALRFLYCVSADASVAPDNPELLSGVPALHDGALGLVQRMKWADGTRSERSRVELANLLTLTAAYHVLLKCPDCPDCAALRARGEMCGLKGCCMCAPAVPESVSPASSTGRMKVCARCRTVSYCCAEHQREDWKAHKPTCKALCRAAEAAAAADA
jgi:hypothetical protein